MNLQPLEYLNKTLEESVASKRAFVAAHGPKIVEAASWIAECVRGGGKLLIMGNGGSAADAQHMAAEMIGRMLVERRPLPAIALTTDSSNLTAVGNDYGYEFVFLRQIEALAKKGDVVLAISTSGNSKNVILAAEAARKQGCRVIGLAGGKGGKLRECCDLFMCVDEAGNASRIQESHIFAVHGMVDVLDRFFLKEDR